MTDLRLNIIYLLLLKLIIGSNAEEYTLKSVNVLFRHGDRTPLDFEYYPKDPLKGKIPGGYGELTNKGKLREFTLGESLRQRYDDFLGQIYVPSDVEARSTDSSRTQMSTQLVLAGLYPPKDGQIWNEKLNWQPIPVSSVPKDLDPTFKPYICPQYIEELARVKNTDKYKKDVSKFDNLLSDLREKTGQKMKDIHETYILYFLLDTERAAGLELPEWTQKYFPNGPIRDAMFSEWYTMTSTNLLQTITGGLPLRKVLKNFNKTIEGKMGNNPKISLYGVHESNIYAILISLNMWMKTVPEYSSAVIFELHQKGSEYFVKMLYYSGIPAEYKTLVLPGCTEYCEIKKFIDLNKHIIPKSAFELCYGPASNSKLVPKNENPIEWIYKKFDSL